MGIWDEIKDSFKRGTSLTRLIYLNAFIFLFIKVIEVIGVLSGNAALAPSVISFLAVPASVGALAGKPWTPLTYMFTHQGFIHIIFNMMWLWWFGKIFLNYLDQRKLVSLYIMGGLAGALLYIAVFNIFPAFAGTVHVSIALGASASVMALVIATAVYLPELELHLLFLGRIKLKYLAIITFLHHIGVRLLRQYRRENCAYWRRPDGTRIWLRAEERDGYRRLAEQDTRLLRYSLQTGTKDESDLQKAKDRYQLHEGTDRLRLQ